MEIPKKIVKNAQKIAKENLALVEREWTITQMQKIREVHEKIDKELDKLYTLQARGINTTAEKWMIRDILDFFDTRNSSKYCRKKIREFKMKMGDLR